MVAMALLRYRDPGDGQWRVVGQGPTGDRGPAGAEGQPGVDGSGFTQAVGDGRYLPRAGGTMLGELNMGGMPITNLRPAVDDNDVVRFDQVPVRDSAVAQVSGGTQQPRGRWDAWIETDQNIVGRYDDDWIPLTMDSDWGPYSGINPDPNWSLPAYRKTPFGIVQFRGLIARKNAATDWTDFATLPAGYGCGTNNRLLFQVHSSGYAARVDVIGNVLRYVQPVQGAKPGYVSLAGISYFAES